MSAVVYTSPIVALAAGMRAFMLTVNPSAKVAATGWKQRTQQLNQGGQAQRILLIPGKLPTSTGSPTPTSAGKLRRGKNMGDNPRALLEWDALVTMSVWAVGGDDQTNEEAHIQAVTSLYEQAVQAVHRAVDPDTEMNVGLANITWGDPFWTPNTELRFGLEILTELTIKTPLFDVANAVTKTASAVITKDLVTP